MSIFSLQDFILAFRYFSLYTSICTHFWEKCTENPNFNIFIANKIFKTLFNIYIFCRHRSLVLVKFLFSYFNITKFYNRFFPFYICFQKFLYFFTLYASVFFHFCNKIMALLLLIKLIIQQ